MSAISVADVQHATLPALRAALQSHAVWFALPQDSLQALAASPLSARAQIHRLGPATGLVVDHLSNTDLPLLASLCRHVLVHDADALQRFAPGQAHTLATSGLKLYLPHDGMQRRGEAGLPRHARIGRLEFLLSTQERLAAYPWAASQVQDIDSGAAAPVPAVFVLDQAQDFEVLRPQLERASGPASPLKPRVAITKCTTTSSLWPQVRRFLQAHALPWFKPVSVADALSALGNSRALLVTASTTGSPDQFFSHLLCRNAHRRTLRVMFQHDHECAGLRHHPRHDRQFPLGTRLASDVIFTWSHASELPDLSASDRNRCVPVGISKHIAECASSQMEAAWNSVPATESTSADRDAACDTEPPALIVAECRHGAAPQLRQRFEDFITALHTSCNWPLLFRRHPGPGVGKNVAASKPDYRLLKGLLEAKHIRANLGVVSAPSTILLDAAVCGMPAAVWSDDPGLGDAENYQGLPLVANATELVQPLFNAAAGLAAHTWAVANTSALNGASMAWQQLCNLAVTA